MEVIENEYGYTREFLISGWSESQRGFWAEIQVLYVEGKVVKLTEVIVVPVVYRLDNDTVKLLTPEKGYVVRKGRLVDKTVRPAFIEAGLVAMASCICVAGSYVMGFSRIEASLAKIH